MRIKKLQEYIRKNGYDAFFVSSYENWRYFSGFTGSNAYLLITENQQLLVTDQRYTEQAEKQAQGFEIITHGLDPFETLQKVFSRLDLQKVAFESRKITDFQLRNLRKQLPEIDWQPTVDVGKNLRAVKDEAEIKSLIKAVDIADEALEGLLPFIKPGMTEKAVAVELEYLLAKSGSEPPAFGTIVASGLRSSLPHGKPTAKEIEKGDFIVIDFAGRWNGYMSDITRTIRVGEPRPDLVEIFGLVEKAIDTAIAGVKPGVDCNFLDKLARDVFVEADLEQYSLRGLGHGVGLEIHEYPRVVMDSKEIIQENMVFTVEPGLYLPEKGGVRLEDIVRVTANGCEILTRSPRVIKI